MHLLEALSNVASVVASFVAVSAPAAASARTADVLALRAALASISPGRYVVVLGPKGVGKTCVVATALQRTCGVIHVDVSPGAATDSIVTAALASIAGMSSRLFDPRGSARRVLWWYSTLSREAPIVVLHVIERPAGSKDYAETAGAVRILVGFGLRAVIDSSPNSLEPGTLTTIRQRVLELGPMPRELLFSLPEHVVLFDALRREDLADAAWAVLGGVPAHYEALHDLLRLAEQASASAAADAGGFRGGVELYLLEELSGAISRRADLLLRHPELAVILDRFKSTDSVSEEEELALGVVFPSPSKVVRVVRKGRKKVVVPSDAAMALVLRHCFMEVPTLDELRALLRTPPPAAPGVASRSIGAPERGGPAA